MNSWLNWKDPDAGKDWGQEEKGTRGWDGWMASPTWWTWVWVNSRSRWWTGSPGVLLSMGLQRVGHNWVTELNWSDWKADMDKCDPKGSKLIYTLIQHELNSYPTELNYWFFPVFYMIVPHKKGFPDSSVGKESTCNVGDPGLIPGSGRSPGEGIGYPFQYSWASLVAQLVKNLPSMQETWVWSLGWDDPLEKERLPTPVFWPGEFHGQSMGSQRVGHDWVNKKTCRV